LHVLSKNVFSNYSTHKSATRGNRQKYVRVQCFPFF